MTIGDLIVRVGAQVDGYKSGMADASATAARETGKVTASVSAMSTSVSSMLTSMGSKLSSVGTTLTAAVTLPIIGVGAAALKASADMDSMRKGLDTITHNAAETEKQLTRLKEVAKIPGLDFQGAVKGSINLQAAGFSANMAERALKAFGNALASVGKGREDLEGVNLVLTQIINKPKVMAQDLNQLRERLPQISQMMKAAFGSSVSEDIQKLGITGEQFVQKIITEFEKLPPAASGLKNSFENVKDAAFQSLAKLGDNLAPIAMRTIDVVINPLIAAVSKAASAFAALPGPVQNAALGITAFLVVAGPAAAIVGKLVTTVTALAGIYTTLSALITARVIPALFGTQAAVSAVQVGTLAMGSTFTAAGSTITGTMAAATTSTLSLGAALGGIVTVLAAVVAGYVAWKNIKDSIGAGSSSTGVVTPGGGTFHGFYAMPGAGSTTAPAPTPTNIPNARDYVTSLPAPRPALGGMDAEEIKKAFAALGLKNLKADLDEATKAFHMLAGAGLLTHDQMLKAATAIAKMREELKGAKLPAVELVGIVTGAMPTLEQLQNLPIGRLGTSLNELKDLPTIDRNLGMLNDTLATSATEAALAARNAGYLTEAFHLFGLKTPEELREVARQSEVAYEMIRDSGTAVPETIFAAWEKMTRDKYALLLADGSITKKQYDDMMAALDATHKNSAQRRRDYERSAWDDMKRAMSGAFDNLARGLARSIIDWKDWGKNLKSVLQNLGEELLSIMIKALFEPLKQELGKLAAAFGAKIAEIFTGGNSGGGGGGGGGGGINIGGGAPPGSGGIGSPNDQGNAGGGFNASSAPGWVGVVTNAVSDIVAGFQRARTNDRLELINQNTLKSFNILTQMLTEMYVSRDQFMLKYDDIWNEIRNVVDAVRVPFGNVSTGVFESIRDSAALQVRKIDEFIIPKMDKMITLLGAKSSGNTFNFSIQSNDPREVVDQVAQYLRAQGVFV